MSPSSSAQPMSLPPMPRAHYIAIASPLLMPTMDDRSIQNLLERATCVKQLLLEQSRLGRVPRSRRFTEGMMLTMESVGSITALTNRFTKKSTLGKYFSWRIRNQLTELEKEFESRVLLLREIAAEEQPLVENQFDSIPQRSTASYRETDRIQGDLEVDLHDESHPLDRIARDSQTTDLGSEVADRSHPSVWILTSHPDGKPTTPATMQVRTNVAAAV